MKFINLQLLNISLTNQRFFSSCTFG